MTDNNHEKLVHDLKLLLSEAESFQFHDFKNTKYAAPKSQLIAMLLDVCQRIKLGEYDNSSE